MKVTHAMLSEFRRRVYIPPCARYPDGHRKEVKALLEGIDVFLQQGHTPGEIYRHYLGVVRDGLKHCSCSRCETTTARAQRGILAALDMLTRG
jgi:hypothetical protein